VDISALSIHGAYLVSNSIHRDDRGHFTEWFRSDVLAEKTGLAFSTAQANLSVSARGTVRGIHYADVPPGQAKYVMCVTGAIKDFVVDIRVGSPTFASVDEVTLRAGDGRAVVIDVGLGHAFVALEPNTSVVYLVTDVYKPHAEHEINPLDSEIGLEFGLEGPELLISEKDRQAPTLREAMGSNRLPVWQAG